MSPEQEKSMFEKFLNEIKDAPVELKKAIYEEGRKEHIKQKPLGEQIRYHLGRNNWILALVIIGGLFIGTLWTWSNIFKPLMTKFGIIEQKVYDGYIKIPKSFQINKGIKPTKDTVSKLEIKPFDKEKDKDKNFTLFVDKNGNVFSELKNSNRVKVVSMKNNFDWRLQPGLGCLISPLESEYNKVLEPAIFVSPLEIYDIISLDGFTSISKIGGGISYKLPFKWTNNTYIGGGISTSYDTLGEKTFLIYAKINF